VALNLASGYFVGIIIASGEQMASFQTELGASSGLPDATPLHVNVPQLEGVDLQARYHSEGQGGDFFDARAVGPRVIFLLADIAGRPPESQAIAAEMQNAFRTRAQELFELPEANESEGIALLARDVNRALIQAAQGVRFTPAFLGCFNRTLGILTYHNAGRILAVFHDAVSARILEPDGIPLGLFTHSTYEPAVLVFEPRAKLLLVTKGITESRRGATVFGSERVKRLLDSSDTDSASEICEAVLRDVNDFETRSKSRVRALLHPRKRRNRDDLTAVALMRRLASGGARSGQIIEG
jgi:serine phosphatase RsbU (regulator of sigma subunit)